MTENYFIDVVFVLGLVQTIKSCFKDSKKFELKPWQNVLLNIACAAVAIYSPKLIYSLLFVAAGATVCWELGYNPLLDFIKKKVENAK